LHISRIYNKKDVPEESRFAYKDIEEVINNELDLVTPIKKLSTIGVVKG
jgi:tRNA-splicing ligase RtcB